MRLSFLHGGFLLLALPLLAQTNGDPGPKPTPPPLPYNRTVTADELLAAFIYLPYSGLAEGMVRDLIDRGPLLPRFQAAYDANDAVGIKRLGEEWVAEQGGTVAFSKRKLRDIKSDVEGWLVASEAELDTPAVDARIAADHLWFGYIGATACPMTDEETVRAPMAIGWIGNPFVVPEAKATAMEFLVPKWDGWFATLDSADSKR